MAEELTPESKIMLEKLKLMSDHRFFASILLHFNIREVKDAKELPTMAVNAKGDLFYNPNFVNALSSEAVRAVLCHEVLHVVLRHCYRFPEKVIPEIWNIAVDLVVNDILTYKEGITIPKLPDPEDPEKTSDPIIADENGIYRLKIQGKEGKAKSFDLMIRDKPAETIYYEIMRLLEKDGGKGTGKQSGRGEGGPSYKRIIGKGFDKHDLGDDKKSQNGSSQGQGQDQSDGPSPFSEDAASDLDRKWSGVLASANMEESDHSRGEGKGWVGRMLKDFAKPQLNWRSLLRRHIKETIPYDSSYKYPRRRTYSTGIYLPITSYRPHIITVAIDISGSIGDKELATFITEVYGITRAYNNVDIRVIFWSTEVDSKNDVVYKARKIREVLDVKANTTGGTTISCVEDYISEHDKKEASIIYITDGYVENDPIFRCTRKKRLFIIAKNGSTEVLEKYGPTARLKD